MLYVVLSVLNINLIAEPNEIGYQCVASFFHIALEAFRCTPSNLFRTLMVIVI